MTATATKPTFTFALPTWTQIKTFATNFAKGFLAGLSLIVVADLAVYSIQALLITGGLMWFMYSIVFVYLTISLILAMLN